MVQILCPFTSVTTFEAWRTPLASSEYRLKGGQFTKLRPDKNIRSVGFP